MNSQPDREKEILEYWDKNNIFKIWNSKHKTFFPKKKFIFYDGPPFANGLPHYGHILAGTIKDTIPRYKVMRGYETKLQWGWDCHGLPVEVEIEKQLNLKNKKDIEGFGIKEFNMKAKESVLKYADEWKKVVKRFARWVDMENDYRTMDTGYMESIWNVFSQIHKRGYVKEGYKVLHYCSRCGTPLAKNEVTEGYKETEDLAVYVALQLKDNPNEYVVVWTTTPWTLLGNTAVALNKEDIYVRVKHKEKILIVSKKYAKENNHETISEVKGSDLIGKEYIPPFDYFNKEEGIWKIHHAPYVGDESGVGIVHLAPAYGAEDYDLAQKNKIPLIHHVKEDGTFVGNVGEFSFLEVKPVEDYMSTDKKIADNLEKRGILIKSEIIKHNYPFCWRCDSPLLNYAISSWFIDVPKYKKKLLEENGKTNWVPKHIKDGRFGKWLQDAPEWPFSRNRFWGTPIPIWKNRETGKYVVISSIKELKDNLPSANNKYFISRHGHSMSNKEGFMNQKTNKENPLTELGVKQANKLGDVASKEKIDLIISSPLQRCQETAKLVSEKTKAEVITENDLGEVNFGKYEGEEYKKFIDELLNNAKDSNDIYDKLGMDESFGDIYDRVAKFMYSLEGKYKGRRILIISHSGIIREIQKVVDGIFIRNTKDFFESKYQKNPIPKAKIFDLDFKKLPHDDKYHIDLHRPYIDNFDIKKDNLEYKHEGDVFDCWFESGSMPYASVNYPNNEDPFDPVRGINFPADFIAEGQDQTRGWFNSLITIGVGAFGRTPFKNVIVNGVITASDGKKMSKKLKNYTDPVELANKVGTDAIRQYLLNSPVVRGEDIAFSDKEVEELNRKVITRLINCNTFYKTYSNLEIKKPNTKNFLDRWILARLNETIKEMTTGYESYMLDKATRPVTQFIDDLSTWYLRRSRKRMKEDAVSRGVMRYVLLTISKAIAPSMPFTAEYIYRDIVGEKSVHLEKWPKCSSVDRKVIERMKIVREVVSLLHDERVKASIKVRQPLLNCTVPYKLTKEEKNIIKDEVNVREVVEGDKLSLNIEITEELREEGFVRELIRHIQKLRKEKKYKPTEVIENIYIETDREDIIKKYIDKIKSEVQVSNIIFDKADVEVEIGKDKLKIKF